MEDLEEGQELEFEIVENNGKLQRKLRRILAATAGFEPATPGLGNLCSIP